MKTRISQVVIPTHQLEIEDAGIKHQRLAHIAAVNRRDNRRPRHQELIREEVAEGRLQAQP